MPETRYLFALNAYGWLEYAPHFGARLPWLEPDGDVFHLYWPGAVSPNADPLVDSIPEPLVARWPRRPTGKPIDGRYPIAALVEAGLPDELPTVLAYHVAVNPGRFTLDRPVAGLPPGFAARVAPARFELDARYLGAVKYLRWLAESHQAHPLFDGFDSLVRDRLLEIPAQATRLYFAMLGDCRVDRERAVVTRHGDSANVAVPLDLWPRLACYLSLVGQSGDATYAHRADLLPERLDGDASFHGLSVGALIERLRAWPRQMSVSRAHGRATSD